MPELPEVETTKEGIRPHLEDQIIDDIRVRNAKLRIPVTPNIDKLCANKRITGVTRRAKYIVIHLCSGHILIHLGMSGHLRLVPKETEPGKHDHLDLCLSNGLLLRYCDPRRFGLIHYTEQNLEHHPLLAHLGPEPLTPAFNSKYLFELAKYTTQPIKSFIMNNDIVVGVGNIYATESLYWAGIHPKTATKNIPNGALSLLTNQIKKILAAAIAVGGTTLRDFYSSEGTPGYFQISLQVYGRHKQCCFQCNTPIECVKIAGRNSAFCPKCQPIDLYLVN